jgi:hypothetical protein
MLQRRCQRGIDIGSNARARRCLVRSAAGWFTSLVVACGPGVAEPPSAPRRETPADEILRVAEVWQSTAHEKSLLSPPSPVSVADVNTESTVRFSRDGKQAKERLIFRERFQLHDGRTFECGASAELELGVAWGRRRGEAAVQLTRPAATVLRRCVPEGFGDATLEPSAGPARFVIRADRLLAVDPPLEKRVYLPIE